MFLLDMFFGIVLETFFVTFWSPFGLLGTPWGCQMEEKKGAKLMFFRDPPFGCHFGVILGGFLVDFGRFLVPFGEASERYFGNVFLCLLLPCRGPFTRCGREFRVLCCFGSLVFFCLAGVPWCFLWSLVSLSPVYERSARASEASEARGAIEWCSLVFPVFVCVLVFPLPV